MKLPGTRIILVTSWRILSTAVIVSLGIALLLFGRLETLLPGYSKPEVLTAQSASSLQVIADNPINAPYKLAVLGITQIARDPLLATRITTAVFGTLTILLFYYMIRRVHSGRIAFLATLLFACSAWFLHVARIGTTDIMFPFAMLAYAVSGYWLMRDSSRSMYSVIAIFVLGLSIYVPGMLWFVLAALLIRRKKDIEVVIEDVPKTQLIGLGVLLVGLVLIPLAWAVSRNPAIVLSILGLPDVMPNVLTLLHNLASVPVALFAYTHQNPVMWLGNLAQLDIAAGALFLLGVYYYFKFRKLDRAKLLATCIIGTAVLIALDGGVTNAMLLPIAYVCIAGGIALLVTQWFTVFPRNPLAQTIGIILVTVIVGVSMVYSLKSYFVAWPHWRPTQASFMQTDADLIQ